ncbi:MAG: ABC transporter permease subunit [Gammaproteobacteria bacterium]|nr:ABC transporter permease subunit [Gammaproteobacteria bacterium]MCW8987486.1 ABC transporter permease subunit [Gammaproteobacteria bacterium]
MSESSTQTPAASSSEASALAQALTSKMNRARAIKNKITSVSMAVGGISVIIAIVLIFFYLAYVVFPLFLAPEMERTTQYPTPAVTEGKTLHLAIEEQNSIAVRFTDQAKAIFFNVNNGQVEESVDVDLPQNSNITSFTTSRLAKGFIAFGLSDGKMVFAQHKYRTTYFDDIKKVVPSLAFPLGETPLVLDPNEHALTHVGLMHDEEKATFVAYTDDNRLLLNQLIFDDELTGDAEDVTYESTQIEIPNIQYVNYLLIDNSQSLLYVAHNNNEVSLIDISDLDDVQVLERKRVVADDAAISEFTFLTGEISLLVGDNKGRISQWFPVQKETGLTLSRIRDFDSQHTTITDIVTEQRRKGFAAIDDKGQLAFYHSTAHRTLLHDVVSNAPLNILAVSPRANTFITEDNQQQMQLWHIENEHPEMSWGVLWDQIWYESYPEPSYTWQSSSASNDFEPKFSLMPLAFGTLKAAFYAMLFAMPLAIMGAIYTAYFMSAKMRGYVKPTIEIMEALPTVILGFLAGLWLAPVIESHLPGFFSMLLILPAGVLLFAFLWQKLPEHVRHKIPDGWQAALLIPVLLITGWIAMSLSLPMEHFFFGGDMKIWLSENLGMDYDQRNSLVVGIAMGVAVIPTIFSITEDAIFSVPKNLTFGSLALGATPWQTLIYVVILTASPGIFSAVMIGMGRAVGETMIVLMATGNTPVMDFSIFQGMRTLAANVAVEMPESEVDSTHYRILFLAALVLFVFTFVFNTLAEIIRHRLRKKYSSL